MYLCINYNIKEKKTNSVTYRLFAYQFLSALIKNIGAHISLLSSAIEILRIVTYWT